MWPETLRTETTTAKSALDTPLFSKSLNLLITGIPKVTAVHGFLDDQALRKLAASGNLRTFDVA